MSLLRVKDLVAMNDEELKGTLKESRQDLMHEKGLASMGGAPPNPGKIRALRKNIARILTVQQSKEAKE